MSDKTNVILAIDEGTSGTRAAVVAADGHVSCLEYTTLQVESPRPGVVEQDANVLLEKTIAVCRATLAQAARENFNVIAMAIATQRATAILWDMQTGRALVPAMVWQDTRYASELDRLAATWDAPLRASVGRPVGVRSPYLWAARHLRETPAVAEAWAARRLAFGTVDSWLLWHLSTARACMTTPTNATSCSAYVLGEHRYLQDWVDAVGFPRELLPALHQDADDFGRTRADVLGIDVPILACAGDQLAGAVGLGCLDAGQSMCLHGTGSFVDLVTGPQLPSRCGQSDSTLTMTARRVEGVSHFSVETFVATTGSALNWICDRMHWFDDARQISALAATVNTSRGVTFIPALTGLRVPSMTPDARATINGMSMSTTQAELAFAILEGVAHSVASCIEANRDMAGVPVTELVVGGGLSASDPLLQMQADLTGLPIHRMRESDRASLRGIAYLAGGSGLLWDSLQQARTTTAPDATFMPAIGEDERAARRALWHARVASELNHVRGAQASTAH
ncbi:FGGY family carbohydrate kinase [Cupriavidus plantarum]|uniref:ATP:glycerol 3-phosphotransferase n=1 Tax=Cupriavidus plantarum TaxID=942865 RepID=A0A316ES28_9BURK|nr:FGGY family carbohydrate kinase [Cupriavidus plantarum]NYI02468.1 glycerol kinase [Cupriavidus plantarum]PWK33348.1 glycerol kinase [Cupriavidus plantarum]REE87715.1 glycerol kinase [Cupriavidus plantarum]CAG2145431.1 Glycerol kinase [Cupriavidus plantarum]SMR86100.1 glycerol kinase [Cupriavidus plantarum]